MKQSILVILFSFLVLGGCELFQNNSELDYGHCNEELFEIVKNKGSVKVFAVYEMDYTPEYELTEEEAEAQRKQITEMHDSLLIKMKGLNISGVNKMKISPMIAMFTDEEALAFLCTCELVKEVQEVEIGTTQ